MRAGRLSEYFQGAIVDERSGFAVSLEYASSLKIIPLSTDKKAQANEFDARFVPFSLSFPSSGGGGMN